MTLLVNWELLTLQLCVYVMFGNVYTSKVKDVQSVQCFVFLLLYCIFQVRNVFIYYMSSVVLPLFVRYTNQHIIRLTGQFAVADTLRRGLGSYEPRTV